MRNRDGYRGNRTDADVRRCTDAANESDRGPRLPSNAYLLPRARPGNAGQPL